MVLFDFEDVKDAKNFCKRVMGMCEVCQAVQRPRNLKSRMEWTPIPPKLMVSVCLDIFHMPTVKHKNNTYNKIALCVDRHLRLIVAVP